MIWGYADTSTRSWGKKFTLGGLKKETKKRSCLPAHARKCVRQNKKSGSDERCCLMVEPERWKEKWAKHTAEFAKQRVIIVIKKERHIEEPVYSPRSSQDALLMPRQTLFLSISSASIARHVTGELQESMSAGKARGG